MSLIKRERPTMAPTETSWPDERIDRAFREMLRDFFTGGALLDRFADLRGSTISLEEYVDGDTCVIRAELPGVDPDKDIEIEIVDGMLRVRASREERHEDERPDGYRSEFRYGSFERTVRLPEGATENDVTATYKDGILEVRVPVAVTAAPTRIAVSHG